MKILSVDQLYEADRITVKKQGIDSTELMERAATQVFEWMHRRLQGTSVRIHIFCGMGNNGGDGLVLTRLLIEQGYQVLMYVVNYSDTPSKDFSINYDRIKKKTEEEPTFIKSEDDFPAIHPEDIIVDAIFGIGLNRCPDGWVKKLVQYLNTSPAYKFAIDIPSGLFANEPLMDKEAVLKANFTLTFQTPKLSFFLPETAPFVSNFVVLDIGLDTEFIRNTNFLAKHIQKSDAQKFYIPRKKFGHKGTYGHGLIVAGSYGKMGAAVLSTLATLRIGAGIVTAFVPKCGYQIMQISVVEAMVLTDSQDDFLSEISIDFEASAIGVGMGIGKNKKTGEALSRLFQSHSCPFVIDADALNLISENKELLKVIPKKSILTPHPGELKRLIGTWKNDYEKLEKTKHFSKKHEVVVVIKGANTITVYGDKLFINSTGNPGMGTAGSGDVLSGVITGLLCQGYDPLSASLFGVFLHGSAGDMASHELGYESVIAGDIINNVGNAYLELLSQETFSEENQP